MRSATSYMDHTMLLCSIECHILINIISWQKKKLSCSNVGNEHLCIKCLTTTKNGCKLYNEACLDCWLYIFNLLSSLAVGIPKRPYFSSRKTKGGSKQSSHIWCEFGVYTRAWSRWGIKLGTFVLYALYESNLDFYLSPFYTIVNSFEKNSLKVS